MTHPLAPLAPTAGAPAASSPASAEGAEALANGARLNTARADDQAVEGPAHPWIAPGGRLTRRPLGPRGLSRGAWTHGVWAYPLLFAGSVVESTLLPWPIEFPLLAVMLRGRGHVFPAALAVTAGSLVGCLIAFFIGAFAFDLLAPSLSGFASAGALDAARERIAERGAWAVFFGMMTPVPVQLTSLAAGLGGVGFGSFMMAATAGRTMRYLSMAVLVFAFGGTILRWWRRRSSGVKSAAILAFVFAFGAALWLSVSQ